MTPITTLHNFNNIIIYILSNNTDTSINYNYILKKIEYALFEDKYIINRFYHTIDLYKNSIIHLNEINNKITTITDDLKFLSVSLRSITNDFYNVNIMTCSETYSYEKKYLSDEIWLLETELSHLISERKSYELGYRLYNYDKLCLSNYLNYTDINYRCNLDNLAQHININGVNSHK